jgi:hypothetical protein
MRVYQQNKRDGDLLCRVTIMRLATLTRSRMEKYRFDSSVRMKSSRNVCRNKTDYSMKSRIFSSESS